MNDQIVCIATFIAKQGKVDELSKAIQCLLEPTRREAGCLRYELNQSLENPRLFMMVEKFKSQADFDLHGAQPYLENCRNTALKECVESASIALYREIV